MTPESTESAAARLAEDGALIRMTLEGRPEAFRSLLEKYQGMVYDLCARVLDRDEEARDVTQETFLLLFRNLRRYRPGTGLANWLYTIALNHCRKRLRRRRILSFISLEVLRHPADPGEVNLPAPPASPSETLEAEEAERLLSSLIQALPAPLRQAFLLRYREQRSDEEIAGILKISLGHARVQLSRARRLLLERYAKATENPPVIDSPLPDKEAGG